MVEVVEYSKTGPLLSTLLDAHVVWLSYSTHVLNEPTISVEVVEDARQASSSPPCWICSRLSGSRQSYSTHVLSEPTVSVEVVEDSKTGLLLSSLLDLLSIVRLGLTGAEVVYTTVSD